LNQRNIEKKGGTENVTNRTRYTKEGGGGIYEGIKRRNGNGKERRKVTCQGGNRSRSFPITRQALCKVRDMCRSLHRVQVLTPWLPPWPGNRCREGQALSLFRECSRLHVIRRCVDGKCLSTRPAWEALLSAIPECQANHLFKQTDS
jgi:hypothetical protein